MDEMNTKDLDYFRRRLLERKTEVEALVQIAAEASDPVKLDQTSVGRLSRMDAMQGQAMAQETERRRLAEISRIDAALARMDDGEFGYCIVSGDPIPRARLELDPSAATTVQNAV